MRRVEDIAHFGRLTKENRAKFPAVYTNCLLMPADIEGYTAKGGLYYEATESGLYFFCDEHRFYRLYFYTAKDREIALVKLDKPVLIEFIYKKGKPENIIMMQQKWLQYDAREYAQNLKMSFDLDGYNPVENTLCIGGRVFEAALAKEQYAEQILKLWDDTHHTFNSALPDRNGLLQEICRKNVYCILEGEKVVAADKMLIKNKRASIWLVAVDKSLRRMGLGSRLESYNIGIAKNEGCTSCFLWVSGDNTAAIKLYEKLGFSMEKEIAEAFVIE